MIVLYQKRTNRHVTPPSGGRALPYLGGGVITFLTFSDPSGACGGLFEKVNFSYNIFVKCAIYSNNSRYFQKRTIEMMENMYKNLWWVMYR